MDVDLVWHPWTPDADVDSDADSALAAHVRGRGRDPVRTGRLCPRCGSARHGRPWARRGSVLVPVSLSRSRPHLVTAVGVTGSVGVDVESVAAVAAAWDPALVLAVGERADTDEERARTWVRKEAVLKSYGVGLDHPMDRLVLADFEGDLSDVPAPPGHVAAVASLRGGRGAPSGTARRRTDR